MGMAMRNLPNSCRTRCAIGNLRSIRMGRKVLACGAGNTRVKGCALGMSSGSKGCTSLGASFRLAARTMPIMFGDRDTTLMTTRKCTTSSMASCMGGVGSMAISKARCTTAKGHTIGVVGRSKAVSAATTPFGGTRGKRRFGVAIGTANCTGSYRFACAMTRRDRCACTCMKLD